MHNLVLTKMQKKFKREMKAFFKNDAGANEHPQTKKKIRNRKQISGCQELERVREGGRGGGRHPRATQDPTVWKFFCMVVTMIVDAQI